MIIIYHVCFSGPRVKTCFFFLIRVSKYNHMNYINSKSSLELFFFFFFYEGMLSFLDNIDLYLVITKLVNNVCVRLGVPFYFVCAQVYSTLGCPPGRYGWRWTFATFWKHSVFGVHLRPVHWLLKRKQIFLLSTQQRLMFNITKITLLNM